MLFRKVSYDVEQNRQAIVVLLSSEDVTPLGADLRSKHFILERKRLEKVIIEMLWLSCQSGIALRETRDVHEVVTLIN